MKVLLLGKAQELTADVALNKHKATLDPGDEADIAISDVIASQYAPGEIPLIVLGTNTIADWSIKQKRPDAVIVKSQDEAIEKLIEKQPVQVPEPVEIGQRPLVLTYSSKGGVGKTTSAVSIGLTLSNMGVKTVVCDFDLVTPDVATYFQVKPKIGIEKYSNGNSIDSLLTQITENLWILPGSTDTDIPNLTGIELVNLVRKLQKKFQVVIGDTPPAPQGKTHLYDIFSIADIVYAVVDQSLFSVRETELYAPMLLMMGVKSENIRIIVNRYSPKLTSLRKIEKAFCIGFRKNVNYLPKIVAVIPKGWEEQVKAGYNGKVLNPEEWRKVTREITGIDVETEDTNKKKSGLLNWLKRRRHLIKLTN